MGLQEVEPERGAQHAEQLLRRAVDVHLKGVWKHSRLPHIQVCLKSCFYTSGTAADFLD